MFITDHYETLRFELKDHIGYLTINREKKLNALNQEVLRELKRMLNHLLEDKGTHLRGLIVSGAGDKAFIAGADIKEMQAMDVAQAKALGQLGQDVTLLFEKIPVPVIACVHGFALGGGCEMAMSCDFILATDSAVFGQPEVKLGLIPGFGGTQRLARLIGRNRAKEIIFTGRNIKAAEAKDLGLVLELYASKEEMIAAAEKILGRVMQVSPHGVKLVKSVMNLGNDLTVPEGLSIELEQFSKIFSSEDMREGTTAFVEKRAPVFTGK
jgi:enoyl-CoA hydratase